MGHGLLKKRGLAFLGNPSLMAVALLRVKMQQEGGVEKNGVITVVNEPRLVRNPDQTADDTFQLGKPPGLSPELRNRPKRRR